MSTFTEKTTKKDTEEGVTKLVAPTLTRQLTSHIDAFSDLEDDEEISNTQPDSKSTIDSSKDPISTSEKNTPEKPSDPAIRLNFFTGLSTDIGGGIVNQDDMEVLKIEDNIVLMVFDGHGRELGQLASLVAKRSMIHSFNEEGTMDSLRKDPQLTMERIFKTAHLCIKDSFKQRYTDQGIDVEETLEGYLTKRNPNTDVWSCTHGGTTATVAVVLDNSRLIIANVGDSTAIWGGLDKENKPIFEELSAEHSPENFAEFLRIRKFKSFAPAPHLPEMRFVYDAPAFSKHQCPAIFEMDESKPNEWTKTGKGNYYKNVRNEWATLVTTPPYARFQDALAFTRSLGDLHLHVYGVSSEPEVREFNLLDLHNRGENGNSVLLVCTDGVWDNWKYPDIVSAVMENKYITETVQSNSAQTAADGIMDVNIELARNHFGNQADNMTAILCYISGNTEA